MYIDLYQIFGEGEKKYSYLSKSGKTLTKFNQDAYNYECDIS